MGVTISQRFSPPQIAGFFYDPAAPIPTQWRNPDALFVLGRQNPAGNPGRIEAADGGGLGAVYYDTTLYYRGGVYDHLFFDLNSLGPAIGSMGGGTSFGPAADILSDTTAFIDKDDAVVRRIFSDHPYARVLFGDDWGPDWTGYGSFDAGHRESIYLANVAQAARRRAIADELGFIVICNAEWRVDTNHGYPARGTFGCSYIDGFCIEKHDYASEHAFWEAVAAGQWRMRDSAGFRGMLHITANSTQTGLWAGSPNIGWIAQQNGGTYDDNPSTAVAWTTAHDLGASFTGTTPSIVVTLSPPSSTVQTGTTLQFTASANNGAAITFKVNGVLGGDSTNGTISDTGLYTAPAAVPAITNVTVQAIIATGQNATASVGIQAAPAPTPPPVAPSPPPPSPSADGNRFVGTSTNEGMAADTNRGCSIFFDEAGTITRISALIDGLAAGAVGTQPFRYSIYADDSGLPGALLATTADGSVTAGDDPAWIPLTLVTPLVIASATLLHLHIHSGLNVVGRYYFNDTEPAGVTTSVFVADTFVGGSVDPFGTGTDGYADISIYADFTPVGAAWDDGTTAARLGAILEEVILEAVGKRITATKTWDPASTIDGAMDSTTITVAGAAVGMPVVVGFSPAVPAGCVLAGAVTSADTVTVTLFNKSGSTQDLASGTLRADVLTS